MIPDISAKDRLLISRNRAGEKFVAALQLYVGVGRRYSRKQFSSGTGIEVRVLETWFAEVGTVEWREPKLSTVLSCAAFLGADFTAEWLGLAAQGAFDLPEPGPIDGARMMRDTTEDASAVVRQFSGQGGDLRALNQVGRGMVTRGQALARAA